PVDLVATATVECLHRERGVLHRAFGERPDGRCHVLETREAGQERGFGVETREPGRPERLMADEAREIVLLPALGEEPRYVGRGQLGLTDRPEHGDATRRLDLL